MDTKSVRESIDKKSRKNRQFFDNLIRLLYVDCRAGFIDDYKDVQLPGYVGIHRGASGDGIRTAREMLNNKEMEVIDRLMTRRVACVDEFREHFACLFNDCQFTALNYLPDKQ